MASSGYFYLSFGGKTYIPSISPFGWMFNRRGCHTCRLQYDHSYKWLCGGYFGVYSDAFYSALFLEGFNAMPDTGSAIVLLDWGFTQSLNPG
jgi:hypothetical protein